MSASTKFPSLSSSATAKAPSSLTSAFQSNLSRLNQFDVLYHILSFFFSYVVRVPRIRPRLFASSSESGRSETESTGQIELLPASKRPSAMFLFGLFMLTYFIVTSGTIYTLMQRPPSVGMEMDDRTGSMKPSAVSKRISSQYVFEGLTGGLLYTLAAAGILIFNLANHFRFGLPTKSSSSSSSLGSSSEELAAYASKIQMLMLLLGCIIFAMSYKLISVFISIKMPGYLYYSRV